MRIRTYLVPPCYLPGGISSAACPTPEGVDIYVTEMLPPTVRQACIDTLAGAFLQRWAACA